MLEEKLRAERVRDLLAVKAAVFNEDFVRALTGYDHAGEVDARDIGLKRAGIVMRDLIVGGVERDAKRLDKGEVGVVAGEGEDEVVRQGEGARGGGKGDGVGGNIDDRGSLNNR